MSGPVSPVERTDLSWRRTGLGLLSVGGLLTARALHGRATALLVVAGVAVLTGLGVLGVLTPFRNRLLQRRIRADDGAAAPGVLAVLTGAVVLVAVAAAFAVLTVPSP